MIRLGDLPVDGTAYCEFDTFDSDGASVTITGLAVTDVEIYKDGGTTTRASDNGYALIDTDGIDVNGHAGCHGFTVDLSDNSDVGFYATGSHFRAIVDAITCDGQTVRFSFSWTIGRLLRPTTAGRTLDVNAAGEGGIDLDNTSGTLDAAQLGADCITAAKIADDAFVAGNFATGAFTADAFAADALVAATFATGAFTADAFAANALVAATFAASSLDGKGDWNTTVPDAAGTAATLHGVTDGKVDTVIATVNHASYGNAKLVRATTPANTFDVEPGGCGGADWGNIANETTARALTNTVIASVGGAVGSVTGAVGSVTANVTTDAASRTASKATGFSTHDAAAVVTAMETNGSKLDHLWEMTEDDGGTRRLTTNALEQAPSGTGGDATEAKQDTIISTLATVAKTGADSDTLETLSDQLDGIEGGTGDGARSVTITVNDGADPLENATVRFTEGGNTYAGGTNVSGVIAFSLDDATYVVTIAKAGYTFAPTTLVVDGTETETYSMSAVSISAPPNASTTTGVMTVYDEEGSVEEGVTMTVQIIDGPGTAGIGYDSTVWTETSSALGVVEFAGIILGAQYKIWRGDSKPKAQTFTAPSSGDSFSLAEVIGRG